MFGACLFEHRGASSGGRSLETFAPGAILFNIVFTVSKQQGIDKALPNHSIHIQIILKQVAVPNLFCKNVNDRKNTTYAHMKKIVMINVV